MTKVKERPRAAVIRATADLNYLFGNEEAQDCALAVLASSRSVSRILNTRCRLKERERRVSRS